MAGSLNERGPSQSLPNLFPTSLIRYAPLILLPTAYLLLVAAEFLALTYVTVDLTGRGYRALAVGLAVSVFWIGILGATSTAHLMVRRWGTTRLVVVGCGAEALVMAVMALSTAYGVWLVGLMATGFLGGLLWVYCEAWMLELAPAGKHGLCVGVFETGVGLGMMLGPAMLVGVMPVGVSPLWWAMGMLVASVSLFALLGRMVNKNAQGQLQVHGTDASTDIADSGTRTTLALTWPLAVMAALGGLMENGFTGILPSLALRLDFSVNAAAWLGALVGAGSALLQAPAGVACDRWGFAPSMRWAWAALLLANGALWLWGPVFPGLLWFTGFVLGGVGGAVYTLVVVGLGHRFQGAALVRGMSLMVAAYSLGTIAGPLLGGWAFDQAGLPGAASLLVGLCVLGGGYAYTFRSQPPVHIVVAEEPAHR